MGTPSTAVTVTPIYWDPGGFSYPGTYEALVQQFLTDVSHDSGLTSDVFSNLPQYVNGSSQPIDYELVLGPAITDISAYPTQGGCTPDTGEVYPDGTGYTACVDDAEIESAISTELTSHLLPSDLNHIYLVLLPKGVESCLGSQNNQQHGLCTISAQGGDFCGYHSYFGSTTIYADLPYAIEDSPVSGYTCSSDGGQLSDNTSVGNQTPNGNLDADTEISVASHEMNEALSDPIPSSGYADSGGGEIGDDCAYIYGDTTTFGGASGAEYNQTINGDHYFIQEEFSNRNYSSDSNFGCVQQAIPQTIRFTSVPPSNPDVEETYVVSATASSGLPIILSVDGASSSVCSINGSSSGSTLTFNATGSCILDAGQAGDSSFVPAVQQQQSMLVTSYPTVSSVSPGSGSTDGGTAVTVFGSNFVSGSTSVDFGNTGAASVSFVSSNELMATAPPESAGTVDITVTTPGGTSATSSSDEFVYAIEYSLTLGISPTRIPDAAVGTNYVVRFSASGGESPYTWEVAGNLPSGLTLSSSGVLSGYPTASGTYRFLIVVRDSSPSPNYGTLGYTLTVLG